MNLIICSKQEKQTFNNIGVYTKLRIYLKHYCISNTIANVYYKYIFLCINLQIV